MHGYRIINIKRFLNTKHIQYKIKKIRHRKFVYAWEAVEI